MEGVRVKSVIRHKRSQKRSRVFKKTRLSFIRPYPHKRLYKKPIVKDDSNFYDLLTRMSLERDYSIYKRTLGEMGSLPRLSESKNTFDCVIQSLYCVGLISYEYANECTRKLTQGGHLGIEINVIIDFLKSILKGVVELSVFYSPPFDMLIRHDIFHNKESTLLAFQRRDNTAHMVVLCKDKNSLTIYDKQADRVYTIAEFLAHENNIAFYALFKITLHKQNGVRSILGIPEDEL